MVKSVLRVLAAGGGRESADLWSVSAGPQYEAVINEILFDHTLIYTAIEVKRNDHTEQWCGKLGGPSGLACCSGGNGCRAI